MEAALNQSLNATKAAYKRLPPLVLGLPHATSSGPPRVLKTDVCTKRKTTVARDRETATLRLRACARALMQVAHVLEGVVEAVSPDPLRQQLDALHAAEHTALWQLSIAGTSVRPPKHFPRGGHGSWGICPPLPRGLAQLPVEQWDTAVSMEAFKSRWGSYCAAVAATVEASVVNPEGNATLPLVTQ